jgi:prophage tail gpP-like protein
MGNQKIFKPIEIDFKSFQASAPTPAESQTLRTFTSYEFDRNLLVPASAFRFSAPGVSTATRLAIRSGDMAELFAVREDGSKEQLATGFIDDTDTHITPSMVDYILTGRDTPSALVDNSAIDANNRVIMIENVRIDTILGQLILNTRIPAGILTQQIPNGQLLFQTNPGETKINALQRYLEFTNCLLWADPNGQLIIGRPDFTQVSSGNLILNSSNPVANNLLEARVKRNVNTAIRTIVTQIQSASLVDAAPYTVGNQDSDMMATKPGVGRSVYRLFTYGDGNDAVNTVTAIGNGGSAGPFDIGNALSLREIAMENMKILDVEAVVQGHLNGDDEAFDVDQIYDVQIEDENVNEIMYVYAVNYSLTPERGLITRLRLCRKGTIVAYADALKRQTQ